MAKINKSKRGTLKIPEGTESWRFFFETPHKESNWALVEGMVKQLPKSKEDRVISTFNEFVEKISELYPEKKKQLELLRPLIIKKIINGGGLGDWYFEELKKI